MEPITTNQDRVSEFFGDQEMQECAAACTECAKTCNSIISYCLQQEGNFTEAAHMNVLMDCVELSQAAASLMARRSSLSPEIRELCAEACERCAESCEEFESDQAMADCARLCRRCSEMLRKMA